MESIANPTSFRSAFTCDANRVSEVKRPVEVVVLALAQIAGTSKRSLLRRSDLKLQAPRSRLQGSSAFNAQSSQSELSLADALQQLDASDRDCRISEPP
jgi:hypothetical protein